MNSSERIPITFSIEVEPLVETLPLRLLVSGCLLSSVWVVVSVFGSVVFSLVAGALSPPHAAMLITIIPASTAANTFL